MKKRRQHPYDPLAPTRPRAQRQQVQRDLKASYNPLAKMIGKSADASARNIEGIYSRLAGDLGGYRATQQGIYDRARGSLTEANTGSAQQLAQTGQAVGGALEKALALSGAGPADYQGDLSRLQAGQQSRGGAQLGELALRQAAAENYAAQLPQFARLAGGQALQISEAQRKKDIAELSSKAQAGLAEGLSNRRRLEYEKAVASRGLGLDYSKLQQDERESRRSAASKAASTRVSARKAIETERHNRNMEQIQRQGEGRQAAIAAETRRHNRAMEKISKGKGLAKKKKPFGGPKRQEQGSNGSRLPPK